MTDPRPLTYDEKKASEAAFRGLPLDSAWTDSAKTIYTGIIQALGNQPSPSVISSEQESPASQEQTASIQPETLTRPEISSSLDSEKFSEVAESVSIRSRQAAIESGILKDVTPLAQSIGLDFCVGITNPLWEQYISFSPDFTEDLIQTRLRDTMIAVRLRLASLKTPTPLVDVPLLLEFPNEATPQLCLTFALFHKDPVDGDCILLIHPGEVFATQQSFENN